MNKIHFWLMGFGIGSLIILYILDFPVGLAGIGIPVGALILGIRQWVLADSHAERIGSAISNKGVGANYDKWRYHEID